jgi:hypothetical protein
LIDLIISVNSLIVTTKIIIYGILNESSSKLADLYGDTTVYDIIPDIRNSRTGINILFKSVENGIRFISRHLIIQNVKIIVEQTCKTVILICPNSNESGQNNIATPAQDIYNINLIIYSQI